MAQSLSEPATRRIDAEESQGMLAAMRRLIQAEHVLRLEVQDERPRPPLPGLEPLAAGLGDQLAGRRGNAPGPAGGPRIAVAASGARSAGPLSRVRARRAGRRRQEWLLAELDEIVDAANSLASLAGLDGEGSAGDERHETAGVARASP